MKRTNVLRFFMVREERAMPGEGPGWGPPGRPPKNPGWALAPIGGAGRTLEHLLGSRTRARLYAVLLVEQGRDLWLREICREVRVGVRGTQRELEWLTDVGLVRAYRRGNMRFFRVNEAHPLCLPLRALIVAAADVDGSPEGRWEEPPVDLPLLYG